MSVNDSGNDASANENIETLLTHVGRDPLANHGVVNPPVYRASTIIHPTIQDYEDAEHTPYSGTRYGRRGTPTTFALEDAVARMEGGYRSIAVPAGLTAITLTLLSFLKTGDHLLMVDTMYNPARRFCDTALAGLGIETTYFDPLIDDLAPLIRKTTRLVFFESPGSLTFEVQDIPKLAAQAKAMGVRTAIDNTWSAGLYFSPFAHGVDVSIQAATKYIVGQSDTMLGLITTNEECFLKVRRLVTAIGTCVSPDDCYRGLSGLRSLAVRLPRHHQNALTVAQWLESRPEVEFVRYPALPSCPGHDYWRRDFNGANGLVSFVLKPVSKAALAAFVDGLNHFAIGVSWGGYESLIIPFDPRPIRTATTWSPPGPCLRIHCGLENVDDLIDDLDRGLFRLREKS